MTHFIKHILSSPYTRTLQTAFPTARDLKIPIFVESVPTNYPFSPSRYGLAESGLDGYSPVPRTADQVDWDAFPLDRTYQAVSAPTQGETLEQIHTRYWPSSPSTNGLSRVLPVVNHISTHSMFTGDVLIVTHALTKIAFVRGFMKVRWFPTALPSLTWDSRILLWTCLHPLVHFLKFILKMVESNWFQIAQSVIFQKDKNILGVFPNLTKKNFNKLSNTLELNVFQLKWQPTSNKSSILNPRTCRKRCFRIELSLVVCGSFDCPERLFDTFWDRPIGLNFRAVEKTPPLERS